MYPDFWGDKIPKRNSAISGWLNTEKFCVKNDPTKRYFLKIPKIGIFLILKF